jgi:polar amino acid transport system substrate-binding protein
MLRLFLIASLLLPITAHAQGLISKGTITWGLAATFPPFESMDNGKPVGFDLDLADAVAKKMGVTSEVSNFEFKGLIPAMLGKRVDAVISGMYINAERLQVADFVPYVLVGDQIVVRSGNPLKVTEPMSLCGHRVAAPVGTAFEMAANKAAADCKAAGKAAVTLLALPGTTTCALALKENRADAIIVSTPTAAALEHDSPGAFENGGAPFANDTKIGVAVVKGNTALKDALDKALQGVVSDGTYAALLKKWNLPAASSAF